MPVSVAPTTLFVSNGHAEDLIGAALVRAWRQVRPQEHVLALPLVAQGRAYDGVAQVGGPLLDLPSGGFPFGSLDNLRADLGAGLVGTSLGQWRVALAQGRNVRRVVVVGDTYALAVGTLAARQSSGAARLPLVHVQPLVSVLYGEGMTPAAHLRELNALGANAFMPWEIALGRRAWRVYTRDAASARYLAHRGVNAAYRGSFAMDVLPAPERDLSTLRDERPVLALLPGQRGDAQTSLPLMLEAARQLPELQAFVAWPRDWAELPPLPGWTLAEQGSGLLLVSREEAQVSLLRGSFSAILHAARSGGVALGTAGTANEQAAGLGIPVVGFPTAGPQYVAGFAARQQRLLGAALTLTPPEVAAVVRAVRSLLSGPRRERASRDGQERIGAAGALGQIAQEMAAGLA
ncbi:MAG: lipid-A-disaccharide synthase-related protein [Deinococcus sp.]|uniref:lipid-A-disaccharide synthase-related protein n=1 Tax=Deinococcus sp. TaxID=47478 RepID=UPI0026DBA81A|nr:lipid-A-disaccharide synthase-related protein [Deinococcus sp.]MDO4244836.1 lipid-A-disaccharide synthase-related protein [Deinococcus sp.]